MKEDKEVMALDALKSIHDVVESIRESSATAFETMILMKVPCNKEIMTLGMMMQAALSFSVALNQWIKLCEEQEATFIDINKHGN
jgi:hypothetical protein